MKYYFGEQVAPSLVEGIAYHQNGQLTEAKQIYLELLKLEPTHFDALQLLATIAAQQGNCLEAIELFDYALTINQSSAILYNNRGNVLKALKHFDAALASFNDAIRLKPDYAEAYSNRGNVFKDLGQMDAAIRDFNQAISLSPKFAEAYYNRGKVLEAVLELDAALADFDRAIKLKPDYVEAWGSSALVLLLMGNFEQGWELYEWRKRAPGVVEQQPTFPQPQWLGAEGLNGKTIFVYSEQGYGDTIQFSRYVHQLAALGARVILEVDPSLAELFKTLSGVSEIIVKGEKPPAFDYHCPLLSLPLAFRTDLASIPKPSHFLLDQNKVAFWQKRLGVKQKLRVGIVWSSVSSFAGDGARSMAFSDFMKCLPVDDDNFEVICLQKVIKESDRELFDSQNRIQFYGDEFKDFSDTAALIETLDLVISTCTSVPHLSATIGKPTWILLPHLPDWRWLLGRGDTPWYRCAKLYRQEKMNGWSGVTQKVRDDLVEMARLRANSLR